MEECRFHIDDVVQHFKRENVNLETAEYLYRILAFAQHTENNAYIRGRGCLSGSRYHRK